MTKQGRTVLSDVTLSFESGGRYAILGPSGAGKTTLLRLLDRLEDPTAGVLWFHGTSYAQLSAITLRRGVAMVFQVPVIFPGSVRDNLCAALRLQRRDGEIDPADLTRALELAGLDGAMLARDAAALSTGEKQRVCIARALMTRPEVLLLDEPTAALDPISTLRVEETLQALREKYCIVVVTHNLQQAARVSNVTGFMFLGELVEIGPSSQIFTSPRDRRTDDYITGRFG